MFQDLAWAERGVEALKKQGLAAESLSILGKASPELTAFIERQLGAPQTLDVNDAGRRAGAWPARRGAAGRRSGAATAGHRRDHAPRRISGARRPIFDALTARGGVLVAIHSEPRAADALAVLHSYGGGNAAIGAWSGRV